MQLRRFLHLKVLISKCRDGISPDWIITSRNESHSQSSILKETWRGLFIHQKLHLITVSLSMKFLLDCRAQISTNAIFVGTPLGWTKFSLNNYPCHRLSRLNEHHGMNHPPHMTSKLLYISSILRYRYIYKIFDLTVNEIEMVCLKKVPRRFTLSKHLGADRRHTAWRSHRFRCLAKQKLIQHITKKVSWTIYTARWSYQIFHN
jgi:hypothetical protein